MLAFRKCRRTFIGAHKKIYQPTKQIAAELARIQNCPCKEGFSAKGVYGSEG
jgi:hypothetical protein